MADMKSPRNKMPEQSAQERRGNFCEVALGFDTETAVNEASRCLNCKNPPCVNGCPVGVRIPDFIKKISEKDFEGAYQTVKQYNFLPAVCGRVCPQENQCEGKCVRAKNGEAVAIGALERFVADYHSANVNESILSPSGSIGKRVAVVGSGPAGLTCAGELRRKGIEVTVFEAFHAPGGVLIYGIPEFRLPKKIVAEEISTLKNMGVEIKTDTIIGKTLTLDELLDDGYDAVFIGSGAGLPQFMGIPGESYMGVYSANEFLTRINLMKAYLSDYDTPIKAARSVAVIGGGNVAMDAARCALRLGAENVYIVYRRSMDELPARKEEVHHAMAEGIEFKLLCAPLEILGDENGNVSGLKCIKMQLGEPDESGRRRPVAIEGSDFCLEVDCVISAIGTSPNPLIKKSAKDIETNKKGCIIVNEEMMTTKENVWAGGDASSGSATVILAMGAGKKAAESIFAHLTNKN